jgi:hypothetical protein
MRTRRFRTLLLVFYLAGFAVILFVAWTGREYYELALSERPRDAMHHALKPGGLWGHTLGIVGSAMLLLLLLYSARKRRRLGLRKGPLARWLDIHILFGILGPLFITLHSAFKFHGIVSVSYFSMMAVMISGFIGRYIYIQIPRDERGTAMSIQEIDGNVEDLGRLLAERYRVPPRVLEVINAWAAPPRTEGPLQSLFVLMFLDVMRPFRRWGLARKLRRLNRDVPPHVVRAIVTLANRKALLMRRRKLLRTMNAVFHLWHVVHKPFAYVMILIMIVHVAVVTAMGYTWIF